MVRFITANTQRGARTDTRTAEGRRREAVTLRGVAAPAGQRTIKSLKHLYVYFRQTKRLLLR